jgi:hypothetical protein
VRGGANIRYFGALDPNLRKGWTEDDAALREAMTDENIDRFLARRLGKSMDMVRVYLFIYLFLDRITRLPCLLLVLSVPQTDQALQS